MSQHREPARKRQRTSCPISFALGIFGDRWTLLVLRDLILRHRSRFKEFLASPEGIATNVLTERLRRLEDAGLITREQDPVDQRQWIYRPAEKAIDLVPMLVELVAWGGRNDPTSRAPRELLEAFERDREGLIRSIQEEARARNR